MDRRLFGGIAGAALVVVAGAGAIGIMNASQARAQGYGGYPCMGMMGPGMMGPMMGWGAPQQGNLNLSVDDVKASLERWIATTGNPRLKPGQIVARDSDTITADIVTVEKEALVQRFTVNRRTGYWQEAQ